MLTMTAEQSPKSPDPLDSLREALASGDPIKLELGTTLGFDLKASTARAHRSLRVFRQRTSGGRWTKVGPVLLPTEEGGMEELLRLVGSLIDEAKQAGRG